MSAVSNSIRRTERARCRIDPGLKHSSHRNRDCIERTTHHSHRPRPLSQHPLTSIWYSLSPDRAPEGLSVRKQPQCGAAGALSISDFGPSSRCLRLGCLTSGFRHLKLQDFAGGAQARSSCPSRPATLSPPGPDSENGGAKPVG